MMPMFRARSLIHIFLGMNLVLLPLAHLKGTIFGLPIYSVEMPLLFAASVYLYEWKQGRVSFPKMTDASNLVAFGISLFFIGALSSFYVNPFSFTGLGMLKTWFVFPLLAAYLFVQTKPTRGEREGALLIWLGVSVVVALASLAFAVSGNLTYDRRLVAWYGSPNYLAIFLAPGMLLVHYFYFHPFLSKTKFMQPVLLLALGILALALFLTHSYAVWISVAVAGLWLLISDPSGIPAGRKKLAMVLLLGLFLGTALLIESKSEKWQTLVTFQERSSFVSRITIWRVATRAIVDNPLFGVGIGRFPEVYLEYQKQYPPYLDWSAPQPHNLYLAVWLQAGLVGLVGFGLFIGKISFGLMKQKEKEAILLLSLLGLYLVYGFFDTPFFKTDLAFAFWFILALGQSYLNEKRTYGRK